MNSRERELVEEWQEEILKLCPQAVIGKTFRTQDGQIRLEVTVPTFEDYVHVQEEMGQRAIDLLTSEGIWIGFSLHYLEDTPVPVAVTSSDATRNPLLKRKITQYVTGA